MRHDGRFDNQFDRHFDQTERSMNRIFAGAFVINVVIWLLSLGIFGVFLWGFIRLVLHFTA